MNPEASTVWRGPRWLLAALLACLGMLGPFSIDTQVWVMDDPEPVIETVETLDGEPRVTYRLEPDEFDRLRVALDKAGLAQATLVPRRSRAGARH